MQSNEVKTCSDIDVVPFGNYIVMLLMTVVFAAQFLGDPNRIYLNGLILKKASFNAFLGYSWLHTGPIHIVENLLLLAVFGRYTCIKIGNAKYFLVYIALGIAAAFAHILLDGRPVIGASGAISGVMGLAVVLSYRKLSPLGPWLVLIWFAVSVAAAVAGSGPTAHIAHIGGFVMGMIMATILVSFKQPDNNDTDHSLSVVSEGNPKHLICSS